MTENKKEKSKQRLLQPEQNRLTIYVNNLKMTM